VCPPLTLEQVATSMQLFALQGLQPCEQFRRENEEHAAVVELLQQCDPTQQRIQTELNAGRLRGAAPLSFHPMPLGRAGTRGFSLAFFRPEVHVVDGDAAECDLGLVLLSGAPPTRMGLRFERGRENDDTHGYAHIQFTSVFRNGGPTTDAGWLPQSYPAFPRPCSAMGDTWLAVLVSLYGLNGGNASGLGAQIAGIQQTRPDWTDGAKLLARARHLFYPT